MDDTTSGGWMPDACTLPSAERPLRLAEFDSLFAAALRAVERVDATRLAILLEPAPGRADLVRDLTRREGLCCAFFAFALTDGDPLRLEVTVPPGRTEVLDALAARAVR
jgi:hypothetical protein